MCVPMHCKDNIYAVAAHTFLPAVQPMSDMICCCCCCCCCFTDRYPASRMKEFTAKLRARGQHWVPIINPAVGAQPGFKAFDEGNRDDVWIKDTSGKPYAGQVSLLACLLRVECLPASAGSTQLVLTCFAARSCHSRPKCCASNRPKHAGGNM
jgi:hypothetical protein